MSETESHEPSLHELEDEQMAEYRPVSVLAVVALVLGLVSSLALVGISLWFVPLLAIAVALTALRQINRPGSNFVGRWAAIAGLALAICFAAWAPAQHFGRAFLLVHQARTAADRWFDVLRDGHLMEAHQWMLGGAERAPRGQTFEAFYLDTPKANAQLEDFKTKEFVTRLQEDPSLQLTYLGNSAISQQHYDSVSLRYRLAGRTPEEEPLTIQMQVSRFVLKKPGRVIWQISRAEVIDDDQ